MEGLVTSLARPGGNMTGLSSRSTDLVGKQLELLKQTVPGISRVALLFKPDSTPDRNNDARLNEAEVEARTLGVRLQIVAARGLEDFDRAFSDMYEARAGALMVLATPVFDGARRRLAGLAAENRLPANVPIQGVCRCRGPDVLRTESHRYVSACRGTCSRSSRA